MKETTDSFPRNTLRQAELARKGWKDLMDKLNVPNLSLDDFEKKIRALSTTAKCDRDFVVSVLQKVWTADKSPSLDDYEVNLSFQIGRIKGKNERIDALNKAAKALIDKMYQASSLAHGSPRTAYFALLDKPDAAQTDSIIQGKRITRDEVEQVITQALTSFIGLQTWQPVNIEDLPRGMKTMELKNGRLFMNLAKV